MREVWHNTCLHLFHCLSQSLSLSLCSGCCVSLCVTIGWVELDLTSSRFVLVMNWVAAARVLVSGRLFFFVFVSLSPLTLLAHSQLRRGVTCVLLSDPVVESPLSPLVVTCWPSRLLADRPRVMVSRSDWSGYEDVVTGGMCSSTRIKRTDV